MHIQSTWRKYNPLLQASRYRFVLISVVEEIKLTHWCTTWRDDPSVHRSAWTPHQAEGVKLGRWILNDCCQRHQVRIVCDRNQGENAAGSRYVSGKSVSWAFKRWYASRDLLLTPRKWTQSNTCWGHLLNIQELVIYGVVRRITVGCLWRKLHETIDHFVNIAT